MTSIGFVKTAAVMPAVVPQLRWIRDFSIFIDATLLVHIRKGVCGGDC